MIVVLFEPEPEPVQLQILLLSQLFRKLQGNIVMMMMMIMVVYVIAVVMTMALMNLRRTHPRVAEAQIRELHKNQSRKQQQTTDLILRERHSLQVVELGN